MSFVGECCRSSTQLGQFYRNVLLVGCCWCPILGPQWHRWIAQEPLGETAGSQLLGSEDFTLAVSKGLKAMEILWNHQNFMGKVGKVMFMTIYPCNFILPM